MKGKGEEKYTGARERLRENKIYLHYLLYTNNLSNNLKQKYKPFSLFHSRTHQATQTCT